MIDFRGAFKSGKPTDQLKSIGTLLIRDVLLSQLCELSCRLCEASFFVAVPWVRLMINGAVWKSSRKSK
eukprot:14276116-Ditylum_brightwellii.AAC.1